MSAATIHLAGELLQLDPAGALHWPARRLLAVSDLHFEKGSAAARQGSLVPPWDTRATLDILATLLRRYRPHTVVALGDSFHDIGAASRLLGPDAARLRAMAEATAFVWVLGNHDPLPTGFRGESTLEHRVGPLVFRHQAHPGRVMGELSGHFHPKASVPVRGTVVTRPCFIADARRIILPAIGTYTGGLDVRDPAVRGLFPTGGRAFLLGQDRVFSFAIGGRPAMPPPALTALGGGPDNGGRIRGPKP
ncbi:MAG: ligase-associated DNA damage response endonuclease PdeM [Alphaproteobacteria bacterium]|nr:ligase-associated DNA damage response endonuclease PdeM [Alphaproteobacteria bacterium]